MRYLKVICLVAITLATVSCRKKPKKLNLVINNQLMELLKQEDYFTLEKRLALCSDSLDDKNRLYYQTYLDNAFNDPAACLRDIDTLFDEYPTQLPDSIYISFNKLQSGCYFGLFQYAKSADVDSMLLKQYGKKLSADDLKYTRIGYGEANALRDIPPQETIIKNNTLLRWKTNEEGRLVTQVKLGSITADGMFERRVMSLMSQAYAKKLGLRVIYSTRRKGKDTADFAVADSLYLGNILIKNTLFYLTADTTLFSGAKAKLLIGGNIIYHLQQINVYKDGRLIIPAVPDMAQPHNFALTEANNDVIALRSNNDIIPFQLDQWARESKLYPAYLARYREYTNINGHLADIDWGRGAPMKKMVMMIPNFRLSLGNKTVALDSIYSLMQQDGPVDKYYGVMGKDFLAKFSEVTYNFKYMYISGK